MQQNDWIQSHSQQCCFGFCRGARGVSLCDYPQAAPQGRGSWAAGKGRQLSPAGRNSKMCPMA